LKISQFFLTTIIIGSFIGCNGPELITKPDNSNAPELNIIGNWFFDKDRLKGGGFSFNEDGMAYFFQKQLICKDSLSQDISYLTMIEGNYSVTENEIIIHYTNEQKNGTILMNYRLENNNSTLIWINENNLSLHKQNIKIF